MNVSRSEPNLSLKSLFLEDTQEKKEQDPLKTAYIKEIAAQKIKQQKKENELIKKISVKKEIKIEKEEEKELLEAFKSASKVYEKCGLTKNEYVQIVQFYRNNAEKLQFFQEPIHLRKERFCPPLPRSVIFVPEGAGKGLYVLLKSKGGIEEMGLGKDNRATKMLLIDTGKIKVFRNGKAKKSSEGEFIANKRAFEYPELLASGIPVKYQGPWRTRLREINSDKSSLFREKDIEKIGYIMEWQEGGELFSFLARGEPSYEEAVFLGLAIAKSLQCFHNRINMVHFDLKPENILLSKDGTPKISDFGFSVEKGASTPPCGSPGFIAPELVKVLLNGKRDLFADPKSDIWSLGCLLAELTHGTAWHLWNGQLDDNWERATEEATVEFAKNSLFPERYDPDHFDYIIDNCLRVNPDERQDIDFVVDSLEKIYDIL